MSAIDSELMSADDRIAEYIAHQNSLDLLRFIACGSVDDGKSTLIGRMLYEAQLVFDDQVASLKDDSVRFGTQAGEIDYALLMDGLMAEREQGITIDVAYRFFSTDHRKFIVADTPGHEQYTRNMITGASTADVSIILVDASHGILNQTRRHSFISSLLGIRHVVLAINKMDLVDYDRTVFDDIVATYEAFAENMSFTTITPIPLSALKGDNIIERSTATSWYSGPTLLRFLETVEIAGHDDTKPFRFPVQWVNRPNADFRGYAGTVAAGQIAPGDDVRVLPSGETAKVDEIILYDSKLDKATPAQAVTITLDRDIDVSRGDVIVAAAEPAEVADQFEATLVWMDAEPGFIGRTYSFKIGTTLVNATITEIKFKYDINTFGQISSRELNANDIAEVKLRLDKAVAFENFRDCAGLGSFVLIDRYSNATVSAGMINFALRRSQNVHRQAVVINKAARANLNGHKARVIWFTGLSGSGKSTISDALEQTLHDQGIRTYILDGDNVRHGLNNDLGFTDADRVENIRRIAEVAKLMVDAGIVVLTAFISPFRSERDMARSMFEAGEFLEVHVDVPLDVAEQRDPKGLYRKARRGELPNFTGIDSKYEEPLDAEIVLKTGESDLAECLEILMETLGGVIAEQTNEGPKS
jgi:bifunctional enzyme CysN/CysC